MNLLEIYRLLPAFTKLVIIIKIYLFKRLAMLVLLDWAYLALHFYPFCKTLDFRGPLNSSFLLYNVKNGAPSYWEQLQLSVLYCILPICSCFRRLTISCKNALLLNILTWDVYVSEDPYVTCGQTPCFA